MKDLGRFSRYLGVLVDYLPNGCITLNQAPYMELMLAKFNIQPQPILIPLDSCSRPHDWPLPEDDDLIAKLAKLPYRSAIGSIIYASTMTRFDVSYAIGKLSKFSDRYGLLNIGKQW